MGTIFYVYFTKHTEPKYISLYWYRAWMKNPSKIMNFNTSNPAWSEYATDRLSIFVLTHTRRYCCCCWCFMFFFLLWIFGFDIRLKRERDREKERIENTVELAVCRRTHRQQQCNREKDRMKERLCALCMSTDKLCVCVYVFACRYSNSRVYAYALSESSPVESNHLFTNTRACTTRVCE